MGKQEFGPLPEGLGDRPDYTHGTEFPPRIPLAPVATILNTGALAADHANAMERELLRAEREAELEPPPMAEV
eukprot:6937698-Alexandrium_andersonii.AAC.1